MPDTWYFRYREDHEGRRRYRNLKFGTARELPHRRDAEKAVLSLRVKINSGFRAPETVNEAIAPYSKKELTSERKSFATIDVYSSHLKLHIAPRWGGLRLTDVRTIAVEEWLSELPLAPITRAKIRNVMSAVFSHCIRHEWVTFNPIAKVRTSSMRLREPDVLTPDEVRALLPQLPLREKAMVMLAGSTGLRRSEMFALRWSDLCLQTMQVQVTKAVVRNRFGNVKTPASKKPVPLHSEVCAALYEWRQQSLYRADEDFLFPSIRLNGTAPLMPDMVLKKIIRPALQKAGVVGKVIGWHSFRHSLATNLRSLGVDVKVAQELLRHANSRITMDIYTRAVSSEKRDASGRQVEMLLGNGGSFSTLHRSAPTIPARLTV